jgi:hypothetical protein
MGWDFGILFGLLGLRGIFSFAWEWAREEKGVGGNGWYGYGWKGKTGVGILSERRAGDVLVPLKCTFIPSQHWDSQPERLLFFSFL